MYILVFFIGIFLSLFKGGKSKKLYLYTALLLGLALFRYGVGSDYFAYKYLFERIKPSIIDEIRYGLDNQEILFRIIGSFFKKIGISYQQYLMIFATLNLLYVSKLCKGYSSRPVMSMFLYYTFFYFVWTFSGIRQGIVLSIGMYYLLKCIEGNNTKKIILVAISLFFIHASALILIVLYFLNQLKIDKKKLIIVSFISVLTAILPVNKLIIAVLHLPIINRLAPYVSLEYSLLDFFTFSSIARIVFVLIGILYYDSFTQKNKSNKIIMDTYLISLNIYFFMKFSELTAARISIYGFYLLIIILVNIYCMYRDRLNKLIFMSFILILSSLYSYKELEAMERQTGLEYHNEVFIPYTNIFNKEEYYFNNRFNLGMF